jgi:CDP-L-myo-inositol myo-inositolphosphotransferase
MIRAMESKKSVNEETGRRIVAFGDARAADRRIAGVSAAGRIVRGLAEGGIREAWLTLGANAALAPATVEDVERLRGPMAVLVTESAEAPVDIVVAKADVPTAMEILRGTAKPSDGIVSHWLNRPISQRLSFLVLAIPSARPVHITILCAMLAVIMFAALMTGGEAGLILGGILFQVASVVDGVDGEMARATFRSSDAGKALDSAVDMATNLLFVLGLSTHLALRDGSDMGLIGFWALGLVVLGASLIAWRVRSGGGPLSFDLLKRSGGFGYGPIVDAVVRFFTLLTSRDCFAFLFMVLILVGQERTALWIFSSVATLWIVYVIGSLFGTPRAAVPPEPGYRGAA